MRDLVMLGVLPFLIVAIFRKPFIGVSLWIWVALFFPNGWVFGIASNIRYNLVITICTILSYLAFRNKPKARMDGLILLVLLFLFWSTLTSVFTISKPAVVWDEWFKYVKTVALFLFVVLAVNKKLHLEALIWAFVLSVGFYGFLEGLKFLASGGGHKIAGIFGHVLGDRNELALAFLMLIPLVAYLYDLYRKDRKFALPLLGLNISLVIAVLGTHSRGGLIGLMVLGMYFVVRSKHKVAYLLVIFIIMGIAVNFLPEEWFSRMDTIERADEDSSFMGRVIAWKLSTILAIQNPFLGGGFKAIQNNQVWFELSNYFDMLRFIPTDYPDTRWAHAAHSIYFQVLGDHGFPGLILFLLILFGALIKTKRVMVYAAKLPEQQWIVNLAKSIQISLVIYMITGAALSFAYFEGMYAVLGMLCVLDRIVSVETAQAESRPGTAHGHSHPLRQPH